MSEDTARFIMDDSHCGVRPIRAHMTLLCTNFMQITPKIPLCLLIPARFRNLRLSADGRAATLNAHRNNPNGIRASL